MKGCNRMGKFDKTLIASDFDGTLKDDTGEISTEVRKAIAYYIEQGGYFTVCTGRSYLGFHMYDPSYINAPVLLANGALAYDYAKGQIAFLDGIGEEGIPVLRAVRDRFPGASIEMYAFDATFAIHLTGDTERHFTSQKIPFVTVDDPSQAKRPWSKVMIGCHECGDDSAKIQRFLKENYDDPSFLPTTGSFIEVMKKGVDKGSGLLKLAKCLSVPRERCYAVGDGYNDLEMLTAAAAGFVPKSGGPEALAAAAYIVRSHNDGAVAHVIEILDGMAG